MKRYKIRKILIFVSIMLIIGFLGTNLIRVTFASSIEKANVIVSIDENERISQTGDLTQDKLLYPSRRENAEEGIGSIIGIIRIKNDYKKIDIDRIGVNLDKDSIIISNDYPQDTVYESFFKNVKLKVEKGKSLIFSKTIIDYESVENLLYKDGGYKLNEDDIFSIRKGETVDLKYILHMGEEAGNELQGVVANMPFYINTEENLIVEEDIPSSGNTDDSTYISQDEIVEIDEEIPLDTTDNERHWAHDCIVNLLNRHVIVGLPHETLDIKDYFSKKVDPVIYINQVVAPDNYITRAETAVLIGRALNLENKDKLMTGYLDTLPGWSKGYIISTTKAGIFKGYPFNLFKANKYITREEMMAVLGRAFEISLREENIELEFRDKEEISNWALSWVKAGYENEVILGYPDNTYRPNDKITRGETFTILCKLMGLNEKE